MFPAALRFRSPLYALHPLSSAAFPTCASRLARCAVYGVAWAAACCALMFREARAEEPPATRSQRRMAAYATLVRRSGVEPTAGEALRFLESYGTFGANADVRGPLAASIHGWLKQLSAPEFEVRQAAQRELSAAAWVPAAWLRPLIEGQDPEAAWRAQAIRDEAGFRHDQMLRAVTALAAGDPATAAPLGAILDSFIGPADEALLARFVRETAARSPRLFDDATDVYDRAPLDGTLVATGARGLVLEFDAEGRERWRAPLAAWSAERRRSGRTLLASLEDRRVVEVERDGRIVWEQRGVAAIRAKPLADGTCLVVDYTGRRVVQWNQAGRIVWKHAMSEPCLDAERLANGHTLIATANQISEVTPTGETVWHWSVQGRINGVQTLPNGRLLVANFGSGEVVELDDEGRVQMRIAEPQTSDAFRTADGSTLTASAQRIAEFGADGVLRRVVTTARYGSARR